MITRLKHIFLLAVAAIATPALSAQCIPPKVRAYIEQDSVLIGDRFTLTIDVEKDQVQGLFFPSFNTNKKEGEKVQFGIVECIEDLPIDTIEQKGRMLHLRKRYSLTAYDEGVYNLGRPSVLYADKNIVDTLYGSRDSLRIVVSTFKIDSTSMLIDIKPVKNLPFRFGEVSGYFGGTVLMLVLLGFAIYLLARHLAKRGKSIADLFKPEPPLPAHIVAIAALEQLQNQKLWQNNKHKEYYSALTDILRTYIDGRFGVGAMEMTTDEIIDAIKELDLNQKLSMDLVSLLRDADLVKFAKATPEAAENESAFSKVYYFVEETKPVEQTDENTEEDK